MFSSSAITRRGIIRAGMATVGTLALRPFGLLPAMAQTSANYRALVCVFLFGGNDSNNTVIPMDDTSFPAYSSLRGSLALPTSELTPTVYSVQNAPYAFHGKLHINQLLCGIWLVRYFFRRKNGQGRRSMFQD